MQRRDRVSFLLRPSKEDADRQKAVCKERIQLGHIQRGCQRHRIGAVSKERMQLGSFNDDARGIG